MGDLLLIGAVLASLYLRAQQGAGIDAISQAIKGAAIEAEKAVGAWKFDPRGNPYDDAFTTAEQKYNLPDGMMRRIAWQESRFNPDAVSPVGAKGLMQFMPSTAAGMGFDPADPFASIEAAGRYMAYLYKATGNWRDAIASYNWGLGNILTKGYVRAPAETVQYASSVMADLNLT